MRPDSCIAFDGSWSHRQNADHCLVDFVDTESSKIVDFEVVIRKRAQGEFDGASNAMECEGLRRMIPLWREFGKVTSYAHDKDAKTRNVISQSGWEIEERIDPNHLIKSFRRKWRSSKRNHQQGFGAARDDPMHFSGACCARRVCRLVQSMAQC